MDKKYTEQTLALAGKLRQYLEADPYDPARVAVSVCMCVCARARVRACVSERVFLCLDVWVASVYLWVCVGGFEDGAVVVAKLRQYLEADPCRPGAGGSEPGRVWVGGRRGDSQYGWVVSQNVSNRGGEGS